MCLTWSDEEVSAAWRFIAKEGKHRRDKSVSVLKENLQEGDKVSFTGKKSGKCTGHVVRIKRKKAIVSVKGRNWDVPLSMLTKI